MDLHLIIQNAPGGHEGAKTPTAAAEAGAAAGHGIILLFLCEVCDASSSGDPACDPHLPGQGESGAEAADHPIDETTGGEGGTTGSLAHSHPECFLSLRYSFVVVLCPSRPTTPLSLKRKSICEATKH